MRIAVVNDTSGYHFGCNMVMRVLRENVVERGHEIVGEVRRGDRWMRNRPMLDQADLVLVNGEGSIHDDKRQDLLEVAGEYSAVLINATVCRNAIPEAARLFRGVYVREHLSADEWESQTGERPKVVPDLSLDHPAPPIIQPTEDIGRFDSVANKDWRNGWMKPGGDEFAIEAQRYRRWVTGRFHGVCLAILCRRAFSAYPPNTWKIEGLMADAGLSDDYRESREAALENLPDAPRPEAETYLRHARQAIPAMFDELLAA